MPNLAMPRVTVEPLDSIVGAGLDSRIREDFRRFNNFAEAGEIPTTIGQPHG